MKLKVKQDISYDDVDKYNFKEIFKAAYKVKKKKRMMEWSFIVEACIKEFICFVKKDNLFIKDTEGWMVEFAKKAVSLIRDALYEERSYDMIDLEQFLKRQKDA